jgi:hypothetical protein
LEDPVKLGNVVLWVSQILIRHGQSDPDPAFAVANWHSPSARGERSRKEAYVLARKVRETVARDPREFATLVRQYSEDVATNPSAGSLGGMAASQLSLWPQVLDALAAIKPGEVSQVVETPYGFHIFLRRPPPPDETVTGAHIVIAHDAAGWIRIVERADTPPRTRDEASNLANRVYEMAKHRPEEFSQLVQRFSEHRDASRGGDMGTWSVREPTHLSREIEILAKLAVGEVAPPLDSPVGFQIIQRVGNRPREWYAMEQVRVPFEPEFRPPDPRAKAVALLKATELADEIRTRPGRFAELQQEICCPAAEVWMDGRGSPALTAELDGLQPGEIARRPIQSEHSYVIPMRIEPQLSEPAEATYDLPNPDAPDLFAHVVRHDAMFVSHELQSVADRASSQLELPAQKAARLAQLQQELRGFDELNREQRIAAFEGFLTGVKDAVGEDVYPRYWELLNQHFANLLLNGPP